MSNLIMQLTNLNLQVNNIANQIQGLLQGILNNPFNANLFYNISFQIFSVGTQMFNIGIQSNNIGIDFDNINQKMMNLEFEINKMKISFQNKFPMMNIFPIMNNNFTMMNQEKFGFNNDLSPKHIEEEKFNISFQNSTGDLNNIVMNGKSTVGEAIKKYIREYTNLPEDIARHKFIFLYIGCKLEFDSKEKIKNFFKLYNPPTIIVIRTDNLTGG